MKSYPTEKIRNVGLFGHQGAGKTSLTESLLYVSGSIERMGKVEEGHTVTDFDPDEIKRQMTVFSSLAPFEWNKDYKINAIDTPGFFDFIAENICALRAAEGAILVAAANSGMEVGFEKIWSLCEEKSKPRIVFVNKMDKENANFQHFLDECAEKLKGATIVPLQLPIGAAESFKGVVDLVSHKAYTFGPKGEAVECEIPQDMADEIAIKREQLTEAAADADETLMEKYLDTMELDDQEISDGITKLIQAGSVVPVLCGSATAIKGISLLADAIVKYIPVPNLDVVAYDPEDKEHKKEIIIKADPTAPAAALIFKTSSDPYVGKITYLKVYSGTFKPDTLMHNSNRAVDEKVGPLLCMRGKTQEKVTEAKPGDIIAISKLTVSSTGETLVDPARKVMFDGLGLPKAYYTRAIKAKSKADEDKLSANLTRVMQEDPTLSLDRVEETHQVLLSGIGDMQLDLCVERLKRLGVDVELSEPKIPYRETLKGKADKNYRHKKQAGGKGQFGEVTIEISGLPRGEGFQFVDNIVGGVVSKNYIPAVEKGIRKAMEEGILSGNQVVDVQIRLYDGKMHDVDSSDMAFQIAGSMAFKEGAPMAKPVILEPIYKVEVVIPDAYMGDVIGDLNSKRGRISGMDPAGNGLQCVKAEVPQAEMLRYSIDLRSITQGRGQFAMNFDHYEETPPLVADKVIAAYKAAKANA